MEIKDHYEFMTYQKALELLKNNRFLIPPFQRNFVWGEDDIANLFDSINRGYPINQMVIWKTKGKFLLDEKGGSKNRYSMVLVNDDFFCAKQGREKPEDECLEVLEKNPDEEYYCLIDGQQRITALNLVLGHEPHMYRYSRGKGKSRNKRSHWNEIDLYYEEEDKEDPEDRSTETDGATGKFAFRKLEDKRDGISVRDAYGNGLDHIDDEGYSGIRRLLHALLEKDPEGKNGFYFYAVEDGGEDDPDHAVGGDGEEETNASRAYSRAAEIYVRLNSTGKNMSRSDVLIANLSKGMDSKDFKKKLNECTKKLRDADSEIFRCYRFTDDFVLSAAIYIYTGKSLSKLMDGMGLDIAEEDSFQKISAAIKEEGEGHFIDICEILPKILRANYLSPIAISRYGDHFLFPIMFYIEKLFEHGHSKEDIENWLCGPEEEGIDIRSAIRRFVLCYLTAIQEQPKPSTTILSECRKRIEKYVDADEAFRLSWFKDYPFDRMFDENKDIWEQRLNGWLESPKGRDAFILLSYLYSYLDEKGCQGEKTILDDLKVHTLKEKRGEDLQSSYEMDHCYSIAYSFRQSFDKPVDRLYNLQFLSSHLNASKKDSSLKEWYDKSDSNRVLFLDCPEGAGDNCLFRHEDGSEHLSRNDPAAYEDSTLDKFFETRKENMRKTFVTSLGLGAFPRGENESSADDDKAETLTSQA